MADDRYGERGRSRSNSIFSDDEDRNRVRQGDYGRSDERGFFERAGEAVGNFFGVNEEERGGGSSRRNYQDYEGNRSGGYGRDYGNDYDARRGGSSGSGVQSWGQANDDQSRFGQSQRAHGGGQGFIGRSSERGASRGGGDWQGGLRGSTGDHRSDSSPFDDHYRSWRDEQISQLDREYDEYCQHRQQQFESDFHDWRQSRPSQVENAGQGGVSGQAEIAGNETEGSGSGAMALGGATAESGNSMSAVEASTGSSPAPGSRSGRGGRPKSSTN